MNDIIIVGGGLGGLAAGALCARAGARVRVLERAAALGGRARTDVEEGHAFNQGGHALFAAGAALRVLRGLGVTVTGKRPPARGLVAIARGELHTLPSGLVSMLATDLFGFGAKLETARVLATIARIDPAPLRDVTWRAWTEQVAPRPEVRAALGALARVTTYADAPDHASAGATIAQIKSGLAPGVLYLDGGWQTLVDGLERVARDAGATIAPGAPATAVAPEDGGFTVTLASGEELRARSVVLATGPATARKLLGARASGLGAGLVPVHAACLDVGLSALPRPDRPFALGIDRPTYFSVHSASARLAPTRAAATIHVMKYLDPSATHDPRADERELEEVLDRMQPGWRARVVAKRFLPSLVATNALVVAGGRRPGADATGLAGAFVAGDWVGNEGMLADSALASARAAADLALAHVARAAPPAGGRRYDGRTVIDAAYREHARFVWGLCYRMTGSAADADDLVQETFARALASPPPDTSAPWRPWLVRVAVNLARDRLRRRKRAPYTGPWLPSPIDTEGEAADDTDGDPERRYGMLESVTFAFLIACEALTPRQRAVLLLRDVLEYSVEETARALDVGAANVKTTHHRARAAMEAYDAVRALSLPTRQLQEATRAALERFTLALTTGDLAAIEAALTPAARTVTDAGGEFRAALRDVIGASRVGRFYLGLVKKIVPTRVVPRLLNGLPALVIEVDDPAPWVAPRLVLRCDLGADGRIARVDAILARAKLSALRPPA